MSPVPFHALRLTASLLRGLSVPFLVVGWVATPVLAAAARCEECAREWDPRLWQRGQHTDPHPPPGA